MSKQTTCPRCSECEGEDHHWMPNSGFGNDPADADGSVFAEYVCKHCPAIGEECYECRGEGEIADDDDPDGDDSEGCRACCGTGVRIREPGDTIICPHCNEKTGRVISGRDGSPDWCACWQCGLSDRPAPAKSAS